MDESEILDLLRNEIQATGFVIIGVTYDEVDQKYQFQPGTTRRYLEKAADQCGYDLQVVEGPENEGWVALKRRSDGVIPKED